MAISNVKNQSNKLRNSVLIRKKASSHADSNHQTWTASYAWTTAGPLVPSCSLLLEHTLLLESPHRDSVKWQPSRTQQRVRALCVCVLACVCVNKEVGEKRSLQKKKNNNKMGQVKLLSSCQLLWLRPLGLWQPVTMATQTGIMLIGWNGSDSSAYFELDLLQAFLSPTPTHEHPAAQTQR